MTDPSDSHLEAGTMLAHYRLVRPLGKGAMGRVYLAHDTGLERDVAVKVLRSEISGDESTVVRFMREARAAARVTHPNLAHVHFVGRDGGRHFFAMELLAGRTLEQRVREDGPLGLAQAVEILAQAARGLAAAHSAGVIHRDIKPSNLMLLPDETVKVTDFGLAKSLAGDVDATGAGVIVGTPRYMSPEQCRSEELDWRTDLYSLGLLGWFLLTGKNPVDGENLGRVLDDQIHLPLPPLGEDRPDLPDTVQDVLRKLCEKDRDRRPATMERAIALLETLRPRVLDLAPLTHRLAALAVDAAVYGLVIGGFWSLLVRAAPQFADDAERGVVFRLIALAALLLTQTVFEWWRGASLGKLAFQLRVVHRSGNPPPRRAAPLRLLLRFPLALAFVLPPEMPVLPLILALLQLLAIVGGVLVYFLRHRRTLSDLLTNTRVVIRTLPRHQETAR